MEYNSQNTGTKGIFKIFGWSYAERLLSQGTSFLVSIFLARLLEPEAYGILALANIFIAIVNAATLTGFGSALIQKKEATNTDFSSTLFFSLLVGIAAYAFLYFSAPLIAGFLSPEPLLVPVIRAAALTLITAAVNTVQHAYVIRKMEFRLLFIASVWGNLLSAVIGLFLAFRGFGVWALVAQTLSKSIADIIALVFISSWRPKLVFSLDSIRQVYGFGWKIIASSVADAVYGQLRSLVIGKKYTTADLAYYDKGLQFPNLLISNIDTSLAQVLMPALSRVQDDLSEVRGVARRAMKISSVVLFPLLIGLMVCAEPVILLLLTEKWAPCIPYLRLLCLALMMKPVQTANIQALLAIGRSDIYLKIQLAQKCIGVGMIVLTVLCFSTPVAIAAGEVVSYLLFACINAVPNRKYLDYSIRDQLRDTVPQLLLAIVMGGAVSLLALLPLPSLPLLVFQVVSGAVIYISLARLLRLEAFMYLWELLFAYLKNRRNTEADHA